MAGQPRESWHIEVRSRPEERELDPDVHTHWVAVVGANGETIMSGETSPSADWPRELAVRIHAETGWPLPAGL